jgi:hypothetical protein
MSEQQNQPFQLSFNPSLKFDFQSTETHTDSERSRRKSFHNVASRRHARTILPL